MGGLCAALCILFMFMTALFPFLEFALPAMAGMVLIAVVVENGHKTAAMVYVAVSILAFFIVPNREVGLLFVFFFGVYPIMKDYLDKIRPKILQYLIKFAVFNILIVACYLVVIFVFGISDVLTETGDFGKYSTLILLGMGNVVFGVYDFALKRITDAYIYWFRKIILRKLG